MRAPSAAVVRDGVVDEIEAVALVVQRCDYAVKRLRTHSVKLPPW